MDRRIKRRRRSSYPYQGESTSGNVTSAMGDSLSNLGEVIGRYAYYKYQRKQDEMDQEAERIKVLVENFQANRNQLMETGGDDLQVQNLHQMGQEAGVYGRTTAHLNQDFTGRIMPEIPTEEEVRNRAYEKNLKIAQGQRLLSPATTALESQTEDIKFTQKKSKAESMGKAQGELWKEDRLQAARMKWLTELGEGFDWSAEEMTAWIFEGEVPKRTSEKELMDIGMRALTFYGATSPYMQLEKDALLVELSLPSTDKTRREQIQNHLAIIERNSKGGYLDTLMLMPNGDKIINAIKDKGLMSQFEKRVQGETGSTTPMFDGPSAMRQFDLLNKQIQELEAKQAAQTSTQQALQPPPVGDQNAPY